MIKFSLTVGLFFMTSIAMADCLLLNNSQWKILNDGDSNTNQSRCVYLAGHENYRDRELVWIAKGPGFKTLTFYRNGAITGTSVLTE